MTGGAGFLGSHLCEKLMAQGNEVICVDNLYTGTKRNIYPLLGKPNFEFIRHDIPFPLQMGSVPDFHCVIVDVQVDEFG